MSHVDVSGAIPGIGIEILYFCGSLMLPAYSVSLMGQKERFPPGFPYL